MNRLTTFAAVAGLIPCLLCAQSPAPERGMLSHDVYFTLKDKSDEARQRLVAACQKYLKGHQGTVRFSAGTIAGDLQREVNDRDFDVALHVLFKTKADHDRYQEHPRHKQFIQENQANWAKVRVFDSYVR